MADTRQCVSWALERKCPLREGEQWFLPAAAYHQLGDYRTIAKAADDQRIVSGICVTGWTTESDYSGNAFRIPSSAFTIEERLHGARSFANAKAACQHCEANIDAELGVRMAGCFGDLEVWPESKEFDEQLWQVIERRQLEARLRAAFEVTTPLWYGFWIQSPLKRLQCEVLLELLGGVVEPEAAEDQELRFFLKALKAAVRWELPMHVSFAPLGHTDMGWFTIFPHCPRCKAPAPVPRWQEEYSDDPMACLVCGNSFSPAQTHQNTPMGDFGDEIDTLSERLGEPRYGEFVREFLRQQGASPAQVEEVLDNQCDGPLIRRIEAGRKRRNATFMRLRGETSAKRNEPLPSTLSLALAKNLELELVLVGAGEFWMGCDRVEGESNESPKHRVRIEKPFYIGKYPITQGQWLAVMGENPSKHRGDLRLPIDQVSWFGCQEFCEKLCEQFGRVFRLPSEAEWEYACRAGTTTQFAFGDVLLPSQARFTPFATAYPTLAQFQESMDFGQETEIERENPLEPKGEAIVPVGSYPSNAWGIFDMHGNVSEWCEDAWHPNYSGAPCDGSAWIDNGQSQAFRVVRGGFAGGTEFVCTSSSRRQLRADAGEAEESFASEDQELDLFFKFTLAMMYTPQGFRVVCEAK